MSNIIFKKIILDSFLSYDHEEIKIDQAGVISIRGENQQDAKSDSNGSGKSALVAESLLWCLTGSTSRNASEVANMYLERGAAVTVDLEKDGIAYTITRGSLKSIAANGLTIIKNGVNVTKPKIMETKEYFETEFPELTWSILTSIVVLTQGLVGGLSTMVNRDRKAKLEELAKVNTTYERLKNITDSTVSRYGLVTQELSKKYFELNTRKKTNDETMQSFIRMIQAANVKNSQIPDESATEQKLQAARARLAEAEFIIADATGLLDGAQLEFNRLTALAAAKQADLREKLAAVAATEGASNLIKARMDRNVKDKQTLSAQLSQIKENECPTCHQLVNKDLTDSLRAELEIKIMLVDTDIAADLEKLAEAAEGIRILKDSASTLQAAYDASSALAANQNTVCAGYQSEIRIANTERDQQNKTIQSLLAARTVTVESTEGYHNRINELTTQNNMIDVELGTLSRDAAANNSKVEIAKWFATQLPRALRSYMLEGVIDFINMRCKEYSEYLFEHGVVQLKIDNAALDIYLGNKVVENISGGEHRRLDIILQLAIRDLVMSEVGFTSNLLVIDEVFDNLDSLGVATVLDLITSQKSMINSIFLITHKADADIDYDRLLIVQKGSDNISRVIR